MSRNGNTIVNGCRLGDRVCVIGPIHLDEEGCVETLNRLAYGDGMVRTYIPYTEGGIDGRTGFDHNSTPLTTGLEIREAFLDDPSARLLVTIDACREFTGWKLGEFDLG